MSAFPLAANRAADDNNVAGGPRLFEGTAG